MDLHHELVQISRAFDENGVEYAICGAIALAIHGVVRATTDIDVLIRRTSLDTALSAVAKEGFRFKAYPMTFPDGMEIRRVSKLEEGELLTLDLLIVNKHLENAFSTRQRYTTEWGELSAISRDALIEMKTWAGRPQDGVDIQRLTEVDR